MNSEVILVLVYFLQNICTTVAQPKWSVAMDDKCVFTVSKNWTILFKKNPSLFVTYVKKENFGECRAACCTHQTCNGYVFDGSDQSDSCKLLKCSRNGTDCKKALEKYDKAMPGEVGFITGLAGATGYNFIFCVCVFVCMCCCCCHHFHYCNCQHHNCYCYRYCCLFIIIVITIFNVIIVFNVNILVIVVVIIVIVIAAAKKQKNKDYSLVESRKYIPDLCIQAVPRSPHPLCTNHFVKRYEI